MGLIYSEDDACDHLVPHLASRFLFKRVSYPPSHIALGCRGSTYLGKWGAGGRHSNKPPSFVFVEEILYPPPLVITIGATDTQVQEDVAISSHLRNVNSASD